MCHLRGGTFQASYGAGNLAQRQDYAEVKPCAGSTAFYLAPGADKQHNQLFFTTTLAVSSHGREQCVI